MVMIRRNPDGAIVILGGAALAALIVAILAARPARAAPEDETGQKLDYLADLAETQAQQLQRLVEIGEQVIGEVPIVLEPKILPSFASVPLAPEYIIDFMQIGTPKGQIQVVGFAVPIGVAAGETTTWEFRMPAGWVSVARTPYRFTSDFYDLNLTVEVRIEEEMRPITWGPLPLTGPREVLLDFITKRYGMDVIIVNNTATDALITGEATVVWLEKSYYDDFYLPLMQTLYQAAEGVAR